MPIPAEEIKKLIQESIPDATIEIKDLMGDNNHYSAIIKSKIFMTIVANLMRLLFMEVGQEIFF